MSRACPRRPGLAARSLALIAATLVLAGCATPPVTRLHSLLPADTLPPGAAATPPLALVIAPVLVPAAVDQAPWLVRLPDGTLLQLEHDRWASPLRDEWRAALREHLARRWGALELPGATPAWRLAVELTRFESIAGQAARQELRWTLVRTAGQPAAAGPTPPCLALLNEPVAAGAAALAEGHRRAVARLADRIGRQLRAAARGDAAGCGEGGDSGG